MFSSAAQHLNGFRAWIAGISPERLNRPRSMSGDIFDHKIWILGASAEREPERGVPEGNPKAAEH
jgi:hypothetical protein